MSLFNNVINTLKVYRFDYLVLICLVSGVIYSIYASYTPYGARVPDYSPTVEYIEYLGLGKGLPSPSDCWVCHHPPLYYSICSFLGGYGVDYRHLSLLLSFLTIGVVFFLLRTFLLSSFTIPLWYSEFLAVFFTLFYALWPYSIILSGRVHNDLLFNFLYLLALLFFVFFVKSSQGIENEKVPFSPFFMGDLWFYLALITSSLCIYTKATGLLLVGVGLVSLLIYSYTSFRKVGLGVRSRGVMFFGKLFIKACLLVSLFLIPFYTNYVLRGGLEASGFGGIGGVLNGDFLKAVLLGNAGQVSSEFFVGNGLINFVWFDLAGFFNSPVMVGTLDESGRQYFLNHLLKSSLFGTFNEFMDADIAYKMNRILGQLMSGLFLAILGILFYSSYYLLRCGRLLRGDFIVLLTGGLLLFVALVKFRYDVPAPHHADFRLIYPLLPISLCVIAVCFVGLYSRDWKFSVLNFPFVIFLVLSIIFFLPLSGFSSKVFPDEVNYSYSSFSSPKGLGSRWDALGNHVYVSNQVVNVDLSGHDGNYLEVSVDHNEYYIVLVKSRYDIFGFLVEPTFGSNFMGLAIHKIPMDRVNRLRGPLEWVKVYPAIYERDLGFLRVYGAGLAQELEKRDFVGDDKYSIGHLRLLP